jgi:hypothetical protein
VEAILGRLTPARLALEATEALIDGESALRIDLQHAGVPSAFIGVYVEPDDETYVALPRPRAPSVAESGVEVGFGADARDALRVVETALEGRVEYALFDAENPYSAYRLFVNESDGRRVPIQQGARVSDRPAVFDSEPSAIDRLPSFC